MNIVQKIFIAVLRYTIVGPIKIKRVHRLPNLVDCMEGDCLHDDRDTTRTELHGEQYY